SPPVSAAIARWIASAGGGSPKAGTTMAGRRSVAPPVTASAPRAPRPTFDRWSRSQPGDEHARPAGEVGADVGIVEARVGGHLPGVIGLVRCDLHDERSWPGEPA